MRGEELIDSKEAGVTALFVKLIEGNLVVGKRQQFLLTWFLSFYILLEYVSFFLIDCTVACRYLNVPSCGLVESLINYTLMHGEDVCLRPPPREQTPELS